MSAMASQITGISIVCSTVCSEVDQRKHQSSALLWGEFTGHRWISSQTASNTEMFPYHSVIIMMARWGGDIESLILRPHWYSVVLFGALWSNKYLGFAAWCTYSEELLQHFFLKWLILCFYRYHNWAMYRNKKCCMTKYRHLDTYTLFFGHI